MTMTLSVDRETMKKQVDVETAFKSYIFILDSV